MRDAYLAEGVSMLPERTQFEDGSNGVEAGIQIMLNRMVSGRFKVFSHLELWLSEYRTYHRKDGAIVKIDDDVISASRYGVMSLRFAVHNMPINFKRHRETWRA